MGIPPVRTLDDIVALGREVVAKGYTALKTNVLLLRRQPARARRPASRRGAGFPELNADRHVLDAIRDQLAAFREGAGPGMDILVDLNFNYKTEGFLKMARAMEPFDLFWVEMDTRDAKALRYIRSRTTHPGRLVRVPLRPARLPAVLRAAGGGRGHHRHARGTAWRESLKIAAMADAYEINVAPHNFYGHLATMMSAHFARGRAQPAHHGDRSRHGALAGRPGDRAAARSRTATCCCPPAPAGAPRSTRRRSARTRRRPAASGRRLPHQPLAAHPLLDHLGDLVGVACPSSACGCCR